MNLTRNFSLLELTKSDTAIRKGIDNNPNADQIEKLKVIMQDTESLRECDKIQERITRLASGISVIKVGAATEIEMIEKRHRIEDALEAVKSAQAEGILPGGGSFLVQNSQKMVEFLEDKVENETQMLGVKIIKGAVREPLRQMCLNAGESPDIIVCDVEKQEKNFEKRRKRRRNRQK